MTDLIHVVERAYRTDAATEADWLKGAAEAVVALVPEAVGTISYAFDVADSGWIDLRSVTEVNVPSGFGAVLLGGPTTAADMGSELQGALVNQYLTLGIGSLKSILAPFLAQAIVRDYYRNAISRHGFTEFLAISATDLTSSGCVIGMPCSRQPALGRSHSVRWGRIATHLAAGFRLYRKLQKLRGGDPSRDAEAVLRPDGRVEHATGGAATTVGREALRAAAVAADKARGPMRRRDPDGAVAIWRGLVAGRWSLVDHFDRDGRRYVLAHVNDSATKDPRALTAREREVVGYARRGHSNKLIAYELGLAPSTVGALLTRAMTKLGVSTAVDLT